MHTKNKIKRTLKKSKWLVHGVRKIKNAFKEKADPIPQRDLYEDLKFLCRTANLKNPTFIDGGAHNGSTILKLRDEGFVNSKIYAFEPIPDVAKSIETIGDKNVKIFAKAIGNIDGTIDFNINQRAVTSSPLEPKMTNKYHPGMADLFKKITVPVVKLDTLLKENLISQPDIIKFDLQGYEMFGFQGSTETMKNVKIIFTEVEFVELYEKQPLFDDISSFLKQNDFSLFNLYNTSCYTDGQLIEGDALFINNKYFKR